MRQLRACDFCGDDALGAFEVVPPELSPTEAEQRRVVLCTDCRVTLEELLEPLLARAGVETVDGTDVEVVGTDEEVDGTDEKVDETDDEVDDAAVETPTSGDGTRSSNVNATPADDSPIEESSVEDSSRDATPIDEPTADGSSTGDESSDEPAADHPSDVADSIEAWAGATPSGGDDSAEKPMGEAADEQADGKADEQADGKADEQADGKADEKADGQADEGASKVVDEGASSDVVVVSHADESIDDRDSSPNESEASSGALAPEYGKLLRLLRNRDLPMNRSKVEALASGAYDLDGHEVVALIDAAVERGDLVDDGGRIRLP